MWNGTNLPFSRSLSSPYHHHTYLTTCLNSGLLFHRAILMSGSALSPIVSGLSNGRDLAKRFADRVKCPLKPPSEMLHCLRKIPLQHFIESEVSRKIFLFLYFFNFLYTFILFDRLLATAIVLRFAILAKVQYLLPSASDLLQDSVLDPDCKLCALYIRYEERVDVHVMSPG